MPQRQRDKSRELRGLWQLFWANIPLPHRLPLCATGWLGLRMLCVVALTCAFATAISMIRSAAFIIAVSKAPKHRAPPTNSGHHAAPASLPSSSLLCHRLPQRGPPPLEAAR